MAWDHVVEIEIPTFKNLGAVLAGIMVSLENIVASEFNFLLGNAIKQNQ